VTPLRFEAARRCVIDRVSEHRKLPRIERVSLECAAGRVLAEDVHADRDYPPYPRSIRDGFAVAAAGFQGRANVIGEVRAGEVFNGSVSTGQAVEIMTGAPLPQGTDAVIMIEHVEREGDAISTNRQVSPGDFVTAPGVECAASERILASGAQLDFAGVAVLATVGVSRVAVYEQPRVTVIGTGDELVEPDQEPAAHQIRNSNSYAVGAQIARAGGRPVIAPIARDNYEASREILERALESDLVIISGGVSAGKYDIVENVLADLGAEFYFDRALIQPGQPVVFGRTRETFFFGLPGNPASTMVTFEIFARAALELIAGRREAPLRVLSARLTEDFRHKPGLTRFLPARLNDGEAAVTPVKYQGSGDVFALGRADSILVARDDRESWQRGDHIEVLPR
jgi:molybdopterin molybdotransferase